MLSKSFKHKQNVSCSTLPQSCDRKNPKDSAEMPKPCGELCSVDILRLNVHCMHCDDFNRCKAKSTSNCFRLKTQVAHMGRSKSRKEHCSKIRGTETGSRVEPANQNKNTQKPITAHEEVQSGELPRIRHGERPRFSMSVSLSTSGSSCRSIQEESSAMLLVQLIISPLSMAKIHVQYSGCYSAISFNS